MTATKARMRGHLRSAGTAAAAGLLMASAAIVPVGSQIAPAALAADPLAGCGRMPLDVEFIIDRSGSMGETQWATDGHVRLYWAKNAADGLVDSLDATGGVGGGSNLHHVGLSKFGNSAASVDLALGTSSAATVKGHIDALTSAGNTPLRQGMAVGAGDMTANGEASRGGLPVKHVIILLSDGRPNPDNTNLSGSRPTQANIDDFRASADVVYSVAVGDGGTGLSQVDLPLMQSLAKPASAYRHVVAGSDLPDLFDGIFEDIACTPGIKVVKSASPDQLDAGGGDVTYTFKVTNAGNVALTNVDVTDKPSCGQIDLVSGDTDGDNKLDIDETWTFKCTSNVTESTTDVATATGHDGNTEVKDTSQAHVDVADPTPTPTPTEAPTATPTPTPTDGQPTPTEAVPTPTDAPPSGDVKGETSKPKTTLPPTDTIDGSGTGGTGSGLPIILIALLGIAVAVGLLSPTSNRSRRRNHRE